MSVLHQAAAAGNLPVVQQQLQAGAPPDQPDQNGSSALHHAAKGGHVDIIKMLASAKANINLQSSVGATPLVFAAQAGHAGAVGTLLEVGAQTGIPTRKGKTALTVAQEKNHAQVVAMLQKAPTGGAAPAAAAFGAPSPLGGVFGSPSPLGAQPAFGSGAAAKAAAFGAPAGGAFGAATGGAFGAATGGAFGASAGGGAFGAPAAAKAAAFGAPAPAAGGFGAAAAASGFGALSFGSSAAPAAAFGSSAAPAAAFGSSAAPAAAFGSSAAPAAAFGSSAGPAAAFGSPAAPAAAFGSPAPAPASAFGSPAPAPAASPAAGAANPFGAVPAASSSPFGGGFGGGGAAPAPAAPFGAPKPAGGAGAPFGAFSQPPAPAPAAAAPAPAPASTAFGGFGASSPAPAAAKPFGAAAAASPAPAPAAAPFGAAASPAPAPAANPFGAPASSPASSPFGGGASLAAAFGSALPSVAPAAASPTGASPAAAAPEEPGKQKAHPAGTALPDGPDDSISALTFCAAPPAGAELLAAAAWDGTVRAWRIGRDEPAKHLLTYTHGCPALCACWEPGGAAVVSGGADGVVRSVALGPSTLGEVGAHGGAVSGVAHSHGAPAVIVSASWDRTVKVWDARAGSKQPVHSFDLPGKAYTLSVGTAAGAPDVLVGTGHEAAGKKLLMLDLRQPAGAVREVEVLGALTKYPLRSLRLFPAGLYAKGLGFCCGTYDGRVGVSFRPQESPPPAQAGAKAAAKWGVDFTFKCHRSGHGAQATAYAVNALCFSPKKPEYLATGGANGEVAVWDVRKRERKVVVLRDASKEAAKEEPKCGVTALDFSSDGASLACALGDDWTKGEERYEELVRSGFKNEVRLYSVEEALYRPL